MVEIKGHQNVHNISHLGQRFERRCVALLMVNKLLALDCEFDNDQILKNRLNMKYRPVKNLKEINLHINGKVGHLHIRANN